MPLSLPSVDTILNDSKYLGGLLTVGVTAWMSPYLRPFLLRLALAHFAGSYFVGPFLLNMGPKRA